MYNVRVGMVILDMVRVDTIRVDRVNVGIRMIYTVMRNVVMVVRVMLDSGGVDWVDVEYSYDICG